MLRSSSPVAVIDLAASPAYGKQHIPGAYWGVRSRLERDIPKIGPTESVILTSGDGILANLAAPEVEGYQRGMSVMVLDGGTNAWVEEGLPTAVGMERPISEANDVWYKPYELTNAPEKDMQGYLNWEVGLVDQIKLDGDAKFRIFPR